MGRCIIFGCSNTPGTGISLHEWPTRDGKLSGKWQKFVQRTRAKWTDPNKFSYVCSAHFTQSSFKNWTKHKMGFDKKLLLNDEAVPNIYPTTKSKGISEHRSTTSPKERSAVRKREVNRILYGQSAPSHTASTFSQPTASVSNDEDKPSAVEEQIPVESSYSCDASVQVIPTSRSIGTMTEEKFFKVGKNSKRSFRTQTDPPAAKVDKAVQVKLHNRPVHVRSSTPIYSSSEEDISELSDMSWHPDSEDEQQSMDESLNRSMTSQHEEPKYIIFRSKLWELFEKCPLCQTYCQVKENHTRGSMLQVFQSCSRCNYSRIWNSQPTINNIAVGNILLSAAITFCGLSATKCLRFLQSIGLASISLSTYTVHNRMFVHPTVWNLWTQDQNKTISLLKEKGGQVECAGDGRADSPGHCAKYGTYTLLETCTNKVVTMELVQSNEVGNSAQMEKEGLKKCLAYLENHKLKLSKLVTDRHPAIQKMMREEYGNVRHYYDIWHVAKGFSKKAEALAKQKECDAVRPWIKSIVNHMYWCAISTPDGDADTMEEKWKSVANHIQNIHGNCYHMPLSLTQSRKKKWLKPHTKACEKLCDLILNTRLCRDVRKLSPARQTSSVEAVHSLLLHWTPKHTAFSYRGMLIRHFITCLHFNENNGKQQKTDAQGKKVFQIIFPKAKKGDYTLKKVMKPSTYEYVSKLFSALLNEVLPDPTSYQASWKTAVNEPPALADSYEHPDMDMAIEKYQSMTRYH